MKRCKKCGKTVEQSFNLVWDEFDTCPECIDKKTVDDAKFDDDAIIRIEVNPVDLYWDYMVSKVMK